MFTTENENVVFVCRASSAHVCEMSIFPTGVNMLRNCLVAGLVLMLLCACASSATVPRAAQVAVGLPTNVIEMLKAANIPSDAVGAIVIRVTDGTTVLSHQADASLQPASTMKLLTAIVSLEQLGPTFRGRTELRTNGEIATGILTGDLILRGLGNPDFDWEVFRAMLQTLRVKGIREIHGDLVIDRSAFNPSRMDIGIPPFDEAPEFRYNVIPDALLLNTNLLKFNFESSDSELSISMTPALERVSIESHMTLIDRACSNWEDGWKIPITRSSGDGLIRIQLRGEFPKNCSISNNLNVVDRADYADRLFRSLWHDLGGTIRGISRDGATPAESRLLAEHNSRTLAEFVRDINKRSDNPITRLVYLILGMGGSDRELSANTLENTSARAEQEVRAWLRKQGIDGAGLILENGSGLSRKERIRPRQLAAVLKAAIGSAWAPEFLASLPIVGVDGAMKTRLQGSPNAKHARIKTGTLNNTSAVAGYVTDASKNTCIVVAIINHSTPDGPISPIAKPILDALIDWVARSGGLP